MEFKSTKSIFLQIADTICERIIRREYPPGERIPSVREMAAETGVNPNTVARTFSELQNREIIVNQRGIGFFVNEDAMKKITNWKKEEFFENDLPEFINKVELLEISYEELQPLLDKLR